MKNYNINECVYCRTEAVEKFEWEDVCQDCSDRLEKEDTRENIFKD